MSSDSFSDYSGDKGRSGGVRRMLPEDLDAAILAGGLGNRLRVAIGDNQKVMAEVRERPFLTYLFDQLLAAGVRRAVLCTGFQSEQVESFGHSFGELELCYSVEPKPLGTAGALRWAIDQIDSDVFFVLNGDSFCDTDLAALLAFHQQMRADASIMLTEVEDSERYGRVECEADGKITQFVEKGESLGKGWINAGIYVLSRSIIRDLTLNTKISIEREVFPELIGGPFFGFKGQVKRFIDIGTPESLRDAAEILS